MRMIATLDTAYNLRAFIIRIGFWGIFCYTCYNRNSPKLV